KIRFALPVNASQFGMQDQSVLDDSDAGLVHLPVDASGIARRLAAYSDIGISEFLIHGLDTPQEIAAFVETVMPLVAIRTRNGAANDLPGARISHIPGYLPRHRRS
ncbi:MAG TPA: hypothetical protein VFT89_08150, partial [Rhizobiaceae bacterium]|nr:hypothetical protein [Rhizobiaceae bacterium]